MSIYNKQEALKHMSLDEFNWFADRIETLPSGVVTFSSYAIKKFRKITHQGSEDSILIRDQMINVFGDFARDRIQEIN